MTRCLLYIAPIALFGLMVTDAHAIPAVWSGSLARNIATATMDAANAPLVLVAAAVVAVAAVFAAVAVIGVPAVAAIAVAGSREAV